MLLRMSPLVSELACYDVAPIVKGVACDLSHCDVGTGKVCGFFAIVAVQFLFA